MVLMQQLMQVATQPSPVKALFTHHDVELAAVALIQHLIARSSLDVVRPTNLPAVSQTLHTDDHSSRSEAAPAVSTLSAAVADSAAVANDDVAKQLTTVRTQRRHRKLAVRPPLPVVNQLMDMGFARRKAEAAVKHLG